MKNIFSHIILTTVWFLQTTFVVLHPLGHHKAHNYEKIVSIENNNSHIIYHYHDCIVCNLSQNNILFYDIKNKWSLNNKTGLSKTLCSTEKTLKNNLLNKKSRAPPIIIV